MTTFSRHLEAYPRGRRYTYAARVRGLPYLYSDGRVDWSGYAQAQFSTTALPHLARPDWTFKFESNPLEPLTVGSGINLDLVMDPGGVVANLFAPLREADFELVIDEAALPAGTTVFDVLDASAVSAGTKLYWGLETMNVILVTSDTLTVERGYFGSTRRRYQELATTADLDYSEGIQGIAPMPTLTSHPNVWRGRYVDVLVGVIDSDGTLGDVWPIWAGHLESFSFNDKAIRLSVEPLTAAITRDDWPAAMPKASMRDDTLRIRLRPDDLFVQIASTDVTLTTIEDDYRYQLGTYDLVDPAVFTLYSADATGEWFTLEQLAHMLTDTLVYAIRSGPGSGSGFTDMLGNLVIYVPYYDDGSVGLAYRNTSDVEVIIQTDRGLFAKMKQIVAQNNLHAAFAWPNRWALERQGAGTLFTVKSPGYTLEKIGTILQAWMDDPARPFDWDRGGCWSDVVPQRMNGFLKVSEGDECELVSFHDGGFQGDGTFQCDLGVRGLGGTVQRAWGGGEEETVVEQVAVVHVGESMPLSSLILMLLLSTATETVGGAEGNYDYLGEWVGLGIPPDLVDIEGIIARLGASDMPRPFLFWIEGAGKGKEALESLLLAHGAYFVTRRFTRDGFERFGLSVDVVDPAPPSQYNNRFTDASVLADSSPRVDVNERLIVNQIAVHPHYRFGSDTGDTGGVRYAYAEESIARHRAAKTLELRPSAFYSVYSSVFGGQITDPESVATAIATNVGLRWFGAYSNGNFTLESDTPHIGWKYQAGDRILLELTGTPNPNGSRGYSAQVAKVVDVDHNHGRPGARLNLRLFQNSFSELAPNFRVASSTGSTITLLANAWSGNTQVDYYTGTAASNAYPPPFDDEDPPVTDAMWFEPTRHTDGDGLMVRIWPRGDYDSFNDYEVLSRAGSVLTLDGSPATDFTSTQKNTVGLLGTFVPYEDPSTLRKQYAHLATSAVAPVLGSSGALSDPPKRWA